MKKQGSPLKFYWRLFKLSFPLTLVSFPLAALIGSFVVWAPASEVLEAYGGQTPITVGASYRSRYFEGKQQEEVSRSYLLFPSVLRQQRVVTVHQNDEEVPVVSESRGHFFFLLVTYMLSGAGTWWFWFRGNAAQQAVQGPTSPPSAGPRP